MYSYIATKTLKLLRQLKLFWYVLHVKVRVYDLVSVFKGIHDYVYVILQISMYHVYRCTGMLRLLRQKSLGHAGHHPVYLGAGSLAAGIL